MTRQRAARSGRPPGLRRTAALVVVWVVLLVAVVAVEGVPLPPPAEWDWLRDTGIVVFLVALTVAVGVPPRFLVTLDRLPLEADSSEVVSRDLRGDVARRTRVLGPVGAVVLVLSMTGLWWWQRGSAAWSSVLFWVEVVGAAVAGYVIGGFVAFGLIGSLLRRRGIRARVLVGHPDGAAGLRPVGDFYVRQAAVVAMIGCFAGVWWLLITNVPAVTLAYGRWRDPYLAVVGLCLVIEAFTLAAPLGWAHRLLVRRRAALQPEADRCGARIADLEEQIARPPDGADLAALTDERDRLTARWTMITDLPRWPVDVKLRRLFSWSNVALLLPLVLQWVKAPALIQQIATALGQVL